jgi:hypothetical protein
LIRQDAKEQNGASSMRFCEVASFLWDQVTDSDILVKSLVSAKSSIDQLGMESQEYVTSRCKEDQGEQEHYDHQDGAFRPARQDNGDKRQDSAASRDQNKWMNSETHGLSLNL